MKWSNNTKENEVEWLLTPNLINGFMQKKEFGNIIVTPNPFTDVFELKNIQGIQTIKVYDNKGVLQQVHFINQVTNTELNTSEWRSGLYYIITIYKNGENNYLKVIKN